MKAADGLVQRRTWKIEEHSLGAMGLVLKLAFKILLIPFKIVGLLIGLGLGVAGLATGIAVLAGGLVLLPMLLLGAALLLPLAPLLFGALVVWGVVRLMKPRPVAIPRG